MESKEDGDILTGDLRRNASGYANEFSIATTRAIAEYRKMEGSMINGNEHVSNRCFSRFSVSQESSCDFQSWLARLSGFSHCRPISAGAISLLRCVPIRNVLLHHGKR